MFDSLVCCATCDKNKRHRILHLEIGSTSIILLPANHPQIIRRLASTFLLRALLSCLCCHILPLHFAAELAVTVASFSHCIIGWLDNVFGRPSPEDRRRIRDRVFN
jgi:hypothetical protein